MNPILALLLPFIFDLIKEYIRSTDTDKDDEVLNIVQEGAKYLAEKDNNTVTENESNVLQTAIMLSNEEIV